MVPATPMESTWSPDVAGAYPLPDTLMYVAMILFKRDADVGI